MLRAVDIVVLPFRTVTNSGSVVLAMGHGRVVVVPDLPGLRDLPDCAVVRYDGSVPDLRRTLQELADAPPDRLAQVGAAATTYVATLSWGEAAHQLVGAIRELQP
jgi:hypothetical protein